MCIGGLCAGGAGGGWVPPGVEHLQQLQVITIRFYILSVLICLKDYKFYVFRQHIIIHRYVSGIWTKGLFVFISGIFFSLFFLRLFYKHQWKVNYWIIPVFTLHLYIKGQCHEICFYLCVLQNSNWAIFEQTNIVSQNQRVTRRYLRKCYWIHFAKNWNILLQFCFFQGL